MSKPSSMTEPSASRNGVKVATHGWANWADWLLPVSASIQDANPEPDKRTMPTQPRPGAVAMAAMGGVFMLAVAVLGGVDLAVDGPLLRDGQDVVHRPVEHQARREEEEHDAKAERHDPHDLGLDGVWRGRVQLYLQQHGGHHDGGQNVERVGLRSEEHTSELQSHHDIVCRLLL